MLRSLRNALKERWQPFLDERPGQRFQMRYRHRQQRRESLSVFVRSAHIISGTALALIGLILVPAPGPGWATVFVGLGILAGEFRSVARTMDAGEVKVHAIARLGDRWWRRASLPSRASAMLLLGSVSFATGYGTALFLW